MAQQEAVLDNYEITAEQAALCTRAIFTDLVEKKLTNEAKRVTERLGISVEDLVEKSNQEIKYEARFNAATLTDDIVRMRAIHFELRRRKKLKLVHDTIKQSKPNNRKDKATK